MHNAQSKDKTAIVNSNKSDTVNCQLSIVHSINCDKALVSIGRRAAAVSGLETLGVALERGAVITDEYMRTNVPGVYAAGDVNGKSMLAHTAYREGEAAVNHI